MKRFVPVLVASLLFAAEARAQYTQYQPPPPVNGPTSAEPPPPPPPPQERRGDSAVDLHLDTGWSIRHVDTLTVKAPDFGLGIGARNPDGAFFLTGRFMPGSTSEGLAVRSYGLDLDGQVIWGPFRLVFGFGAAIMTVGRVTRDNTIVGSFYKFNLGPRLDVLRLEPLTVFVHAIGFLGGGDGFLSGVMLGGGLEFDLYKTH